VLSRNLQTGRERKLPALARSLNGLREEVIDSQAVSPDGKWFLRSERWGECLLAEVNGSRSHLYPSLDNYSYRSVLWLADSRRWLEFFNLNGTTRGLRLHDVTRPKYSLDLPIRGRQQLLCRIEVVQDLDNAVAAFGPDQDLGLSEPGGKMRIYTLSLRNASRPRLLANIQIPRGSTEWRCSVSPDGRFVAFDAAVRLPDDRCRTEVWTCDVRGKGMNRIGSLLTKNIGPTDPAPHLWLRWLPSGRKLCFDWHDRLYTIPSR
jgi:hypothetical protein